MLVFGLGILRLKFQRLTIALRPMARVLLNLLMEIMKAAVIDPHECSEYKGNDETTVTPNPSRTRPTR